MARCLPDILIAGDTWKWCKALADYSPNQGWTLTFSFRGTSQLDVVGTPDTHGGWRFIATATETAALAGRFAWQARVTNGDEAYTVDSGVVTVKPGLGAITEPFDDRTAAEKLLAAADEAYLSIIGGKARAQFGDQSFDSHNLTTLGNIRDRLRAEVAAEKASRTGRRRRILITFPPI